MKLPSELYLRLFPFLLKEWNIGDDVFGFQDLLQVFEIEVIVLQLVVFAAVLEWLLLSQISEDQLQICKGEASVRVKMKISWVHQSLSMIWNV